MAKLEEINIGDKVKMVDHNYGAGLNYGGDYTVSDKNDYYIYINGYDKHSGMGHNAHAFEVVRKASDKGEWIIILRDPNGLAPAIKPRIYTTEAQAKAVAASMAEKHPGEEFLILKVIGKAKTSKAIVEMF